MLTKPLCYAHVDVPIPADTGISSSGYGVSRKSLNRLRLHFVSQHFKKMGSCCEQQQGPPAPLAHSVDCSLNKAHPRAAAAAAAGRGPGVEVAVGAPLVWLLLGPGGHARCPRARLAQRARVQHEPLRLAGDAQAALLQELGRLRRPAQTLRVPPVSPSRRPASSVRRVATLQNTQTPAKMPLT